MELFTKPICLSLCDYSGVASAPWAETHRVITADIKNGQDVILDTLDDLLHSHHPHNVDVIIAQPPCTHFASSDARHWASKGEDAVREGLAVADACLRYVAICDPRVWVLEQPVGRLKNWIGEPRFYGHPHEYTHYAEDPASQAYTKKTCLYGRFEAPIKSPWTGAIDKTRIHHVSPGPQRAEIRSLAPEGLWKAIYEANK